MAKSLSRGFDARRKALTLALGCAALLFSARASAEVVERSAFELRPPKGALLKGIRIDNRLGKVSVVGEDRDSISVQATKRSPDHAAIERLRVSATPDSDGMVVIRSALAASDTAAPLKAGSVSVDLIISVPRDVSVRARTWLGDIAVRGVHKGAVARVNRGDIEISDVSGRIDTQSTAGKLLLHDIFGAVYARGVLGDMKLESIEGHAVWVRLHKGDIVARALKTKNLQIQSTSGRIELSDVWQEGGTYKVATIHSDIIWRATGKKIVLRVRADPERMNLPKLAKANRLSGETTILLGGGADAAEGELTSLHGYVTVTEF